MSTEASTKRVYTSLRYNYIYFSSIYGSSGSAGYCESHGIYVLFLVRCQSHGVASVDDQLIKVERGRRALGRSLLLCTLDAP